ncbi:hypothetical protein [Natroniella sp. ANB-PHB2]|uniref:hypothetical protein n=1 Tax=Natroniella sp. ANB-PHB2 TaxID=3384444 RepID=UPI0038D4E4A2
MPANKFYVEAVDRSFPVKELKVAAGVYTGYSRFSLRSFRVIRISDDSFCVYDVKKTMKYYKPPTLVTKLTVIPEEDGYSFRTSRKAPKVRYVEANGEEKMLNLYQAKRIVERIDPELSNRLLEISTIEKMEPYYLIKFGLEEEALTYQVDEKDLPEVV